MPLFQYQAISANGKKYTGVVDADSLESAKKRLLLENQIITSITEKKNSTKQNGLSATTLLQFTRDMASLLKSGLPLYESLLTIAEKFKGHKNQEIFLSLSDQIKQGSSLSNALKAFPKSFDTIYVAMVASAEKTGSLDEVFHNLAKVISRNSFFKRQLQSALIYPAFLGCFCLANLTGLFFFLIPSMKELFEGRRLHPLTTKVLAISDYLNLHLFGLGICLSLVTLVVLALFKSQKFKKRRQWLNLKLPLVGKMLTQSVFMRFCRVFSVLLSNGITTLEALKLSKNVMHHYLFENLIDQVEATLTEGKPMSAVLKKSPLVPALLGRMMETAEEAGNLPDMLMNAAEIYEEEVSTSLSQFSSIIGPVMLLIIGLLVGLVLLAVLLPMTDVSSFT